MKIDDLLTEVQSAEATLARQLRVIAEHHPSDADVHHGAHAQSRQCAFRAQLLHPFVDHYGGDVVDVDGEAEPGFLDSVRRTAGELMGGTKAAGAMLLDDLRDTYLLAQLAEISWQMLVQCAEALRDADLLEVAGECHERAEMCARWLRTRIKVSAAQVYVPS